jgi:hypothetical protein
MPGFDEKCCMNYANPKVSEKSRCKLVGVDEDVFEARVIDGAAETYGARSPEPAATRCPIS